LQPQNEEIGNMRLPIFVKIIPFFLATCLGYKSSAQTDAQMKALNTYVEFLNESVHGLTVAHILFVNYNRDLNKYVDLDSHKMNAFMTNDEVGVSIFDNPDISTSDNKNTALRLSKMTEERSGVLQNKMSRNLNALVYDIVTILNNVNSLRFETEKFISTTDLNQKENIYKSYEYLETAVSYFNNYNAKHSQLVSALRRILVYKKRPVGFLLDDIHKATINIVRDLRIDNLADIDKYMSRILGAVNELENMKSSLPGGQQSIASAIITQVKEMTSFITNQISNPSLPQAYELYGHSYYLHNQILLSYLNSISPGFVTKMNELMEMRENNYLDYDDRAIMYKVTYPEKMQEIESIATKKATTTKRKDLPLKLKMEPVVPAVPEQDYVELEFFDPDLLDRDSISVSLNGEWLLTDYKLEAQPKKLRLDIDPYENNAVYILAKNEGIIAPNTVGFKYRFNGKGKKTYVRKMMNANSGYELILTIEGLGFSDKKIPN